MPYSEDFFDNNDEQNFGNEDVQAKVNTCKEIVTAGQTFSYLENIEETIELCLEYDYWYQGI